jgi:hypothetical protein
MAIVVQVSRDETIARPLADPAAADFAIVQSIYMPQAETRSTRPPHRRPTRSRPRPRHRKGNGTVPAR